MILHQSYTIESILATGVLYGIYLLALRNRPMLVFNRFMLLGMALLGTLLPFINFSLPQNSEIPTSSILIEEVFVNAVYAQEVKNPVFQYQYIYYFMVVILFIYFVVQAIHLIRLRTNSEPLDDESNTYNLIDGKYPHFSFFNQIFINKELVDNEDELDSIIEHEKVHVQQLHSLDILFFEVLKIVFWFNPFIWLFKKLAIENHEYLADRGMLNQTSKNVIEYFNELLQTSLFTYKITLANNFNHSLLKKRVIMMTKKLKTVERLIPLFILPILIFVGVFFACSEGMQVLGEQTEEEVNPKKSETNAAGEELFFVVEEMPQFNGGDHNKFREYIADSLVYPKEAIEKGIVGRVFVQFVVGATGEVRDAIVVRGVDPLLDAEALRVVKASPNWVPGKQRGKHVAVQYTFPVTFMMEEEKDETQSLDHFEVTGYASNNRKPDDNNFYVNVVNGQATFNIVMDIPKKEGVDYAGLAKEDYVMVNFHVNEVFAIEGFSISKSTHSRLEDEVMQLKNDDKLISTIQNVDFLKNIENIKSQNFKVVFRYQ